MKIQPVILCGGAGTRLWPLSREQSPKQLLTFVGTHTLLQATVLRLGVPGSAERAIVADPIIVANEQYRFTIAEQLREVGVSPAAIILEPAGRNTAPALCVAALAANSKGEDPILVVMPADHVILDESAFRQVLTRAVQCADEGRIVTFGIVPTSPETGYGYIQMGAPLSDDSGVRSIARFVEKPDLATAQSYLASKDYLWNSGIFVVRASLWLDLLARFRGDIRRACDAALERAERDADFLRLAKTEFLACPSDSIDYAVMERLGLDSALGAVIPLDAGWSDVGSWSALHDLGEKDADGNVLQGDVIALATQNSLVRSEGRLVTVVGLTDAIVVETADAVLVAHRDRIQDVKEIAARLKRQDRPEANAHRKVHRPWGHYDSIDAGSRFQVKRIVVNPGAQLSLQMHHHRAEHWVVVRGTAKVTRADETFLLAENESTYIPIGTKHRLENPGKVPLEIIEVQSGAYLGEDDIVRYDDIYGRASK
jgi:mannose-1-phosphate guanylyltransferase/mannose-6-phosphate isomerase